MSMIARRNWALRLSIVLNVCVLLYVCAHLTSSGPWIEEPPSNWGGSNAGVPLAETYGSAENIPTGNANFSRSRLKPSSTDETSSRQALKRVQHRQSEKSESRGRNGAFDDSIASIGTEDESRLATKTTESKRDDAREKNNSGTILDEVKKAREGRENKTVEERVAVSSMTAREAILCNEKSSEPRTAQRGDYWVLYNYVSMSSDVKCWESVTYTTHADYTFLDNLEPLLERWRAPISIAMHAPGTDFQPTLDSIKYARNCATPLISQLVTFHIYFSSKHVPKVVPPSEKIVSETYNCSLGPPWSNVVHAKMYKNEKKLLYPVNVGRNVARESAPTYYVLASDIELYPSPNLPTTFLEMIAKRDQPVFLKPNPKVFVLSIFEIDERSKPPPNKTVLMEMLKSGVAIPFHKKLCAGCHNVPRSKEWQETPQSDSLRVFHVGKRTGKFVHWEPIFIGTNSDPLYDERLSWDGKSDKMTQGYALCVLDYDFLILDNAFLVHRPGIKIFKKDPRRETLTAKTNMLIRKIIVPELKVMYGTRKGCAV